MRRADRGSLADGDFCAHSAHGRDAGHHTGASREGNVAADRPVRVRAVGGGEPRDHDADRPDGSGPNPEDHTAPPADTLAKDGAAPAAAAAVTLVNQAPVRIAGQFEVRVEDLAVMPTLESALSESMQGSMSNELDESTFNGAAGELNGLFTQATAVAAAGNVETFATGIARFAALVDGRHAYDLSDVRAVIGSKTFARYAGQFSGNGAVSLFDYLRINLGSIRVSDRVPSVSSNAQKGIVVLSASAEMPKIHVWDAMQIVRTPTPARALARSRSPRRRWSVRSTCRTARAR